MSSLWTPSGEHVPRREQGEPAAPTAPAPGAPDGPGPTPGGGHTEDPVAAQREAQAAVDAMRAELAGTPAEVIVANHCYGLFELAAVYLSQTPPMLFEARLAIDALGALLEGVGGRLGEAEHSLRESLSQLRLAYVRLEGVESSGAEGSGTNEATSTPPR